jgi:hypothetical protein
MERLLKAVKPLFYVSKTFGFAPYSLSKNGKLTVSVAALVYSILLNVLGLSFLLCCLLRFGMFSVVHNKSVPDFGKVILSISMLLTNVLSTTLSLLYSRELTPVLTDALYMCSLIDDMHSASRKGLMTITKLLLLGCAPFFTFYVLFSAGLNSPLKGLLFMPVIFFLLFGPFVVLVQFASLVLLFRRSFSCINTRLIDILSKVSSPERKEIITLSSLPSGLPSAKPVPRRSSELLPSRHTPRRDYLPRTSTFHSQIFSVTHHNKRHSTCLISPAFSLHLRHEIPLLIDIHDNLCDLVRSINSAYSLRILLNVADAFICITVCLFCSYFVRTKENPVRTTWLFIAMMYWGLMKLFVLLRACTTCTEEVSKVSEPGMTLLKH